MSNEVRGIGLAIIDGQTRYVKVNRHLATLNGIPEEAHLGRPLSSVVIEIGPRLTELVYQTLQNRWPLRDVRITARVPFVTGPHRDWLASFIPVNLGDGIVGVAHTVLEISAHARIEAALSDLALGISESLHFKPLTLRENDVLALIGQGKTTKEIAVLLSISIQTVGNHRKQICQKFDLHSTAEIAAYAAEQPVLVRVR